MIAKPDRAFNPVKPCGKAFDRGIAHDKGGEYRIVHFEKRHLRLGLL